MNVLFDVLIVDISKLWFVDYGCIWSTA